MPRSKVPSAAQVRGWRIAPPTAAEVDPVAPEPTDPMRGYTLADLDGIALQALHMDRWSSGDSDERYAAIWHAIAEDLLTAKSRPTRQGLLTVGISASDRHMQDELRHHGRARENGNTGNARPHFERYWYSTPVPSPENGVIEKAALRQVLPLLTSSQYQVLMALALHENYATAAQAIGKTYDTFNSLTLKARRRIYAAWHEGETPPSRPWRKDTRRGQSITAAATGRPRLTAFELDELRARHHAGETIAAIAESAGVPRQTLSGLLRGTYAPAPDSAAE